MEFETRPVDKLPPRLYKYPTHGITAQARALPEGVAMLIPVGEFTYQARANALHAIMRRVHPKPKTVHSRADKEAGGVWTWWENE